MQLFVRRQNGSDTALRARGSDTVGVLKQRVCKLGLMAVRQHHCSVPYRTAACFPLLVGATCLLSTVCCPLPTVDAELTNDNQLT